MHEDAAAGCPACGTLGRALHRGRGVVDDPAVGADRRGQRLQHRIDRRVVDQRQMHTLRAGHRGAGIIEGAGADGLQRTRLVGAAIPDLDVVAQRAQAADESAAHQAGTEKGDAHRAVLRVGVRKGRRNRRRAARPPARLAQQGAPA
jgi:hypothetical protein